jgi:membrane-bound metal-dependent hydrolase YbcI (DUF457 family)
MQGRNHFVVGVATVLLAQGAAGFIQPHTVAGYRVDVPLAVGVAAGVAAIGAMLPDIDLATSDIALETRTGRGQGCLTGALFHALRHLMGGHRALTHSLWTAAVCVAVFGLQFGTVRLYGQTLPFIWPGLLGAWSDMGTAFTLGYLSHIVTDMLTREGVKLWFPLSHAEVGLGPRALRFDTGSWVEYAWVVALLVLVILQWTGWGL